MSGHPRERASPLLARGGVSYILQAITRFPTTSGDSSAYDGGRLRHAEVRV